MKKILSFVVAAALLAFNIPALAVDMASIVKAQVILGQINQVIDKYAEVQALLDAGTIELEVTEPSYDNTEKFLLPLTKQAILPLGLKNP
ncbi:MAG: hypothetical protein AB8B95_14995 [Pseudohongiellaceae bacterium]